MKKKLLTLMLALCLTVSAAIGLATPAKAAKDDTVAGYLVKYTMQAGDTVDGVCIARKLDPNTERAKIAKISNITNFNWLFPGQVLWLPSNTATTDAPYYTLLAVTLETGDTPASLCQEYGVDYNGKYNILTALNSNVTTFMAGQKFILPLYVDPTGKSPDPTPTPTPAAGGGAAVTTPTPTPVPNAAVNPAVAGDTVKFYLAQHTLQSGETVSGICAAMGIDFGNQAEWIRGINGILDWNYLLPGRTILLPVATKPASGSYYQIVEHTVVAGDRVYNLCAAYNMNYYTYEAMIQRLNNRQNLATFYPGEKLYLPQYVPSATTAVVQGVPNYAGVYSAAAEGNPGTATLTINTNGSINLNIVNLTTFNGTLSAAKAEYAVLSAKDPNGKAISFELGRTAAGYDLKVTQSEWDLLATNTVFHMTRSAAPTTGGTTTGGATTGGATTGGTTTDGATTGGTATGTTATPTPTPAVPSADTLSYLVIPHVLQAGETVSGVCADLGVDFMANYDRIMQLSNIVDYNYLMPGKLILIPSTTYPASGPYYKIMAHTLVAGDTVYNLCISYGLNYTNNVAFLQRLNNRDNLATYYVGQTVYMPLYVAG